MLKKLCQSIGAASLILVMNYGDLLGGGGDVRMHVPYRLTGICVAQVADILLVGGALFLLLIAFQRTRFYPWVRVLLLAVLPPYFVERTHTLLPFALPAGLLVALAVVWATFVILLRVKAPLRYRSLVRAADIGGVFLAVFALFSIVQILWVIRWRPDPQQIQAVWQQQAQPPRQHPRLVWVVFDELSYDQLFGHRATGLALPNFDALRGQSTLFNEVQPVGLKTAKILPSLLSGSTVDNLRYGFNNRLAVHYAGARGWHPLDGSETVFHDAQAAGWRTAAVGWYNPYCTIYANALDSCYWSNFDRTDGDMVQGASFWKNTWTPLASVAQGLVAPARAVRESCDVDVRQRIQTHEDLAKHSEALLAADQADFIFLHLAIPHSPNIWSRRDNAYARGCGSSYLDNLVLADRELGGLMQILKQSPRWKDTTLIVQGDHSWRTMIWEGTPSWTDEDDDASQDDFEPRPALLIHAAGQIQPQTEAHPTPLLYAHTAAESVLKGK